MNGIQIAIDHLEQQKSDLIDKAERIEKLITDLRLLGGIGTGQTNGARRKAAKPATAPAAGEGLSPKALVRRLRPRIEELLRQGEAPAAIAEELALDVAQVKRVAAKVKKGK